MRLILIGALAFVSGTVPVNAQSCPQLINDVYTYLDYAVPAGQERWIGVTIVTNQSLSTFRHFPASSGLGYDRTRFMPGDAYNPVVYGLGRLSRIALAAPADSPRTGSIDTSKLTGALGLYFNNGTGGRPFPEYSSLNLRMSVFPSGRIVFTRLNSAEIVADLQATCDQGFLLATGVSVRDGSPGMQYMLTLRKMTVAR